VPQDGAIPRASEIPSTRHWLESKSRNVPDMTKPSATLAPCRLGQRGSSACLKPNNPGTLVSVACEGWSGMCWLSGSEMQRDLRGISITHSLVLMPRLIRRRFRRQPGTAQLSPRICPIMRPRRPRLSQLQQRGWLSEQTCRPGLSLTNLSQRLQTLPKHFDFLQLPLIFNPNPLFLPDHSPYLPFRPCFSTHCS